MTSFIIKRGCHWKIIETWIEILIYQKHNTFLWFSNTNNTFCIPESFNTHISHHLLDYKITLEHILEYKFKRWFCIQKIGFQDFWHTKIYSSVTKMKDFSGTAFSLIQSSFMNLSNVLVKADFILPPDETELALLFLLFTVHQLHMPTIQDQIL